MKKYCSISLISLLFLSFTFADVSAQTDRADKGTERGRSQTFYVEAFGPGLISANYDFRFTTNPAGWGARVGMGYFAADGVSFFSVPVQVNYLLGGKNGNYFEVGGGVSYASGRIAFADDESSGNDMTGSLTFGYRLQPAEGGFNFRAGLSPLFGSGYFIPYWPHLSFGYTF